MNSDAGAIITEYLITTLGNCGHLTKYVITHGLALWFPLGGTCLQGHVVFLRHPKSRDATHGTGTIKSTADCEQTVQIYLLLLVLWPMPVSHTQLLSLDFKFYPRPEQLAPPSCYLLLCPRFDALIPDHALLDSGSVQ